MGLKGLTIEEPGFGTKIFAIGDIHGCLLALEALLAQFPINWGKDLLVFLGDYIDRGPDSRKVIELVLELKETYPEKVVALKGNHEWLFERYLKGEDVEVFLYNGGVATLKNYFNEGKLEIPKEHREFISNLPLYLETPSYIFVHAGINPYKSLEEQTEEDLLWIRQTFYKYPGKLFKKVIFGHTPFSEPLFLEDRIGIDTGCVYGGKLSALQLPEEKLFQIECRR